MPNFRDSLAGGSPPRGKGGNEPRPKRETATTTRTRQGSRSGSSFAARFGRIILQHGIAAIPSALYHYQGKLELSAQQVWLDSYSLAQVGRGFAVPQPQEDGEAHDAQPQSASAHQEQPVREGYLTVHPRFNERLGQGTNAYDFAPLSTASKPC